MVTQVGRGIAWADILGAGTSKMLAKPRHTGLTMVLDRRLGLEATRDLLSVAGTYIDHLKIGFGTAVLFDESLLRAKIELIRSYQIDVYPGGTLFELAFEAGTLVPYIAKLNSLGFNAVEISDGSIEIPASLREDAIKRALDGGLKVITEVGKKDPARQPSIADLVDRADADFECGASFVIIEARESGVGIGVFDKAGRVIESSFHEILRQVVRREHVIWEAPQKDQQVFMINHFGPRANLGNIGPDDVLGLEALRRGLRWDTLAAKK